MADRSRHAGDARPLVRLSGVAPRSRVGRRPMYVAPSASGGDKWPGLRDDLPASFSRDAQREAKGVLSTVRARVGDARRIGAAHFHLPPIGDERTRRDEKGGGGVPLALTL